MQNSFEWDEKQISQQIVTSLQRWYARAVMKVGIQGFEGSFHHQAAKEFFSQDFDLAPFENFRQVFEALETGMVDLRDCRRR